MTEYKKVILEAFNTLTEFEIDASIKSAKDKPQYSDYANIYVMAVNRCRQILEAILKDK